jgi:O-antigen/teichoic acid export membrane protein
LTKNEIRIHYSGLVIFASKILSVSTGMIFTLLLTREDITGITTDQLGIWSNVSDLTGYFTILAPAFPFWVTRFVAREKEGAAKTGFLANLVLAVAALILYIPLVQLIAPALNVSAYINLYLLASAQIVNIHMLGVLEACLQAKKPQAIGYGLLLGELCKISLAYLFMVVLRQHLFGAMVALIIAIAVQIMYYVKLVSHEFRQRIQWSYVKEWVKGSTVNIYTLIGNHIAAFVFILLFVYGGQDARGYYMTAAVIANIIIYSTFLSYALYPKLLATNNLEEVTTSFKMVLMFAIPMTVGALAMPDSYLMILGEPYREVVPILTILAVDALIATLGSFYNSVIFGVEKLDAEARISLRQLAKSNMFKVFTLPYIHSMITLPTTFFVLSNFALNQPVQAGVYVAVINMTARIMMFIILCLIVRRTVSIAVPWANIAKYVFASAVMGATLFVIPHPTRMHLTLIYTALGGLFYLTLLMLIDEEARALFKAVWNEIKFMLGR